jgi:two-component system, NtrC family, response regulator AtoC
VSLNLIGGNDVSRLEKINVPLEGSSSLTDGRKPTVLVWDQDPNRREQVHKVVRSCGATVCDISDSPDRAAFDFSAAHNIAAVSLGTNASADDRSLAVIRALRQKGCTVITYEDRLFSWPIGTRCLALLSGSFLLLDSSSNNFSEELQHAITRANETEIQKHSEEQRLKEQMKSLGIVGVSSQMLSVFRWVVRVSTLSDFPVLINGDTGTGKELIANALYRLDPKRSRGPFIAANCSAINLGLAESELFGHRRGAFTDANAERQGLFRAAEGGVLFLDEIGELSPSLQAKLLRALQEDKVLGVGFDQEISIDVRVIAATNKNLEEMVSQGTFREDLYHRLNVLSVNIPPLRERPEDLQALTEHFLEKHSSLAEGSPALANSEFLDALAQVNLTGNARQLENIVKRALLAHTDNTPLSLRDLTPAEWAQLSNRRLEPNDEPKEGTRLAPSFASILDLNGWNLSKSLEYCERSLLECALQFTRGNQSQTARLIGITPRSVYNKLHKHGLKA